MTTNQRICRNLALGAMLSVWLAVILGRTFQIVHWPWLWVLAPYWVVVCLLMVFAVGCGLLTLALRIWLWLVKRADHRRRERDRREFVRAMEGGFFQGQGDGNRRPRS